MHHFLLNTFSSEYNMEGYNLKRNVTLTSVVDSAVQRRRFYLTDDSYSYTLKMVDEIHYPRKLIAWVW